MLVITWASARNQDRLDVSATQISPCAALIFEACATLASRPLFTKPTQSTLKHYRHGDMDIGLRMLDLRQ
jgi:hypothetical protein